MKVIMDISEDVLTDIKETDFDSDRNTVRSYQATIADAIRNSIVLPDNATNGDVFMPMFPDLKLEDNIGSVNMCSDNEISLIIDKKWLNAQYSVENNK